MLRFAIKRSLLMVMMLAGLLAITFTISHIAPGDPAALAAGPDANAEMIERIRTEYGLDKPLYHQFAIYLGNLLTGDWGKSLTTTRPGNWHYIGFGSLLIGIRTIKNPPRHPSQ